MATDKKRLTISLDDDLLEKVLQYQDDKKLKTQSSAIVKLLELGMTALDISPVAKNDSKIEKKYAELDKYGRTAVETILDIEHSRCMESTIIDFRTIRHYLSSPAAGINGMTSEDYEDIPRTKDMPKDADFCLTVSGDSMEPYIHDGEIVFVNEKAQLQDFEVGVWCVDGATYVKQFCKSYDGNLYLLSANPEREDANITIFKDGNQSVQYFGKVLLDKKLPQPYYKP